jgi:hypothetical protein
LPFHLGINTLGVRGVAPRFPHLGYIFTRRAFGSYIGTSEAVA